MRNSYASPKRSNRIWSGLILLLIGLFFLSRNFGFFLPHWLFSWHVILIVIGLVVGAKRNFTGGGWLAMVVIGGFFTLQRFTGLNMGAYYFPGIFILLGLYLILSPHRRKKHTAYFGDGPANAPVDPAAAYTQPEDPNGPYVNPSASGQGSVFNGDTIDLVNVFSGSKQQIYSKNLLGGEIVAVFGGSDLNFIQADFENTIVLEVTAIFGGVKLVIPPNWVVKADITPVFGGMNDSRTLVTHTDGNSKILVVKGLALFGGIDIRNF